MDLIDYNTAAVAYVLTATLGYYVIMHEVSEICDHQCWVKLFDFIHLGYGDDLFQTEEDWAVHGDCEAKNTHTEGMFVRAPSSSWSNLAFVLAGNTMIGLAIREFGHK